MQIAFVFIAALLIAAIAVQVRYAQAVMKSGVIVTRTTKVVWAVNVALLAVLVVVLGVFMLGAGG